MTNAGNGIAAILKSNREEERKRKRIKKKLNISEVKK